MSIRPIKDIKLNVRPIYIDFCHRYVYEGPCRFGKGDELAYEFDQAMNAENFKKYVADLKANMPEWVNLMDPIEVQRTDDWRIPDEMLETMAADYQEVDYYLYNDGARCGDVMLEFSLRYPKPCTCLSDCRGSTLINASLLSHGVECYPVDGWEELRRVLTAARVRKMLRELRVLTTYRFNAVQSGISAPDSFNSLDKVTEVFGTRFRMINLHELMDMLHVIPCTENPTTPGRHSLNLTEEDMAEIAAMADQLMAGAKYNPVTREDVINTLKMFKVIRKNMDSEDCNAFAAPCPDACATRRLNQEHMTFCLTHSLLGEMGVPSACEYDIPAALSIAILSTFADAPAYMGNTTHDAKAMTTGRYGLSPFFHTDIDDKCLDVVKADPDNVILTWHAVPRRNMRGWDAPKAPYAIRPFAASGFGATLRYDFTQDAGTPITMCRISPACDKLFVAKGEIVGGVGYGDYSCSEGVFFRVKDGNDFFQKQLEVGNHVPLVYGDCFDQVVALGRQLGLEVITA